MSENTLPSANITHSMQEPIRRYSERVRELGKDNSLALILFGAIVAGTFNSRLHAARSVVVLQTIDLEMLRALANEGAKLGKSNIAAPLIMTPDYIQASADTFPLEFIEIQQRHVCVFGSDYFESLVFDETYIRLQCERGNQDHAYWYAARPVDSSWT